MNPHEGARADGNRPTTEAQTWIGFLRARVAEERDIAERAAADGWWEMTEAGGSRLGVQAENGRVLTPVFTGRGWWADHEVADHIIRNQPLRALAELEAKSLFLDLCEQQDGPLPAGFVAVLRQYAEPFHGHPEHPEHQAGGVPEDGAGQ